MKLTTALVKDVKPVVFEPFTITLQFDTQEEVNTFYSEDGDIYYGLFDIVQTKVVKC